MTDTYDETEGLHAMLSVFGKLDVALGDLTKELEQSRRENALRASAVHEPSFMRILGSVVLNASGFGAVRFDNVPAVGHFWYVRKLVIGGATPSTTVAGRGDVFVSSQDLTTYTALAQISIVNWKDQATTLPLVGSYSRGELTVPTQHGLYVIISGGTSGQQVIVAGDIEDYQEGTAAARLGF